MRFGLSLSFPHPHVLVLCGVICATDAKKGMYVRRINREISHGMSHGMSRGMSCGMSLGMSCGISHGCPMTCPMGCPMACPIGCPMVYVSCNVPWDVMSHGMSHETPWNTPHGGNILSRHPVGFLVGCLMVYPSNVRGRTLCQGGRRREHAVDIA